MKCEEKDATRRDHPNCTLEIPITVDGQAYFADPFTWILKDFPTEVPCSSVMPVRWKIQGAWYCASPAVQPCVAPKQFGSTISQSKQGDFTLGLGRGIFTEAQLAQHRAFWKAATSRKAVISKATNLATQHSSSSGGLGMLLSQTEKGILGDLGMLLSQAEKGILALDVGSFLFPLLPVLGRFWTIFSGAMLALLLLKTLANCVIRMTAIYLQRGCGLWVLLGVWNTAFQLIHVPSTPSPFPGRARARRRTWKGKASSFSPFTPMPPPWPTLPLSLPPAMPGRTRPTDPTRSRPTSWLRSIATKTPENGPQRLKVY